MQVSSNELFLLELLQKRTSPFFMQDFSDRLIFFQVISKAKRLLFFLFHAGQLLDAVAWAFLARQTLA